MKKFTRILALLLALISVFSMLVACGGKDKDKDEDVDLDEIIGTETDENPNIPAKDYDGYEFTFITREWIDYNTKYIVSTGEEGNLLDDAIAKRNAILEEKYNIKIKQYNVSDIVTEVRTQIMGGEPSFDAILANGPYMSNMAREGLLYNLLDIERFDMTKSYWDQNANAELKMADKLYYTNCDFNIHTIGFAIYFNKKIISDYGLTSPYEYIENNQWTLDNWANLVKSVSKDVNNDGSMTDGDQFGQLSGHAEPRMMLYGAGFRFTTNDETGNPRVSLVDNSDRLVTAHEKIKAVCADTSVSYCSDCSNVGDNGFAHKWEYLSSLFTQDLYLFHATSDDCLLLYKDMESEFGIIPFPKYDANQENYKTMYPYGNNMFGLPSIIEDVERTSCIIEDMNYYSSFIIEPVWFDTILARRYTRDDESEKCLRMLRDNLVYDIGIYYDFGQFRSQVLDGNIASINIMREYERRKNSIEADIKVIYKDFIAKQ